MRVKILFYGWAVLTMLTNHVVEISYEHLFSENKIRQILKSVTLKLIHKNGNGNFISMPL